MVESIKNLVVTVDILPVNALETIYHFIDIYFKIYAIDFT